MCTPAVSLAGDRAGVPLRQKLFSAFAFVSSCPAGMAYAPVKLKPVRMPSTRK